MASQQGVESVSAVVPERPAKRVRLASPSNGDNSESSSGGESPEEPMVRVDLKKVGPNIWDEHLTRSEVDLDLKAMGCEGYGTMAREDWEVKSAKQMERKIIVGVSRARAGGKEWRRGYLAQGNAIRRSRRKELGGVLPPEREEPLCQQFPVDFMDIERDEGVVKAFEEAVRLEDLPREVTLYEREKVAPRTLKENPILTTAPEAEKEMKAFQEEMATFSNPFGQRLGPDDEIPALLQCVDFRGRPVVTEGLDVADIATEHLPYPLNEVAFLEEFVKPIFAAERDCGNGAILDRLGKCEEVATKILGAVDAVDKRWEDWVNLVQAQWLEDRDENNRTVGPLWTYSICRSASQQLEEEVDTLRAERGNCGFVQYATTLALLRAGRRTCLQLEEKPVMATNLPQPVSMVERCALVEARV